MEIPILRSGLLTSNLQIKRPISSTLNNNSTMYTSKRQKLINSLYATDNKLKRKRKMSKIQYGSNPKIFKSSLKKFMKPELKRITVNQAYAMNIWATAKGDFTTQTFPTPANGTGIDQRIGKKIQIYGLTVKGFVQQGRTSGTNVPRYAKFRAQIILDMAPNGGPLPIDSEIYDIVPSGIKYPNCLINTNQRDRYRILKEFTFELDGIENEGYNFDIWLPVKKSQSYIGNSQSSTDYTSISRNGLFMVITCRGSDGTSTSDVRDIALDFSMTVHYIDV